MSEKDSLVRLDSNIDLNNKDVPYQMLYGGFHIEIFSNRRVSFEGTYKIEEYTTELLKIKKGRKYIVIQGTNISISNVQKESFLLTGNISGLVFE